MASISKISALTRALPLALALLAAAPAWAAPSFDDALQSYRTGRHSEAYGRFLALGLKGDSDAARVALFLGQNGTMLHGVPWELSDMDALQLRKVAQRPSLRPVALPDMRDYEAAGVQMPVPSDRVAGK